MLELRAKKDCMYDAVSLGEVMIRLDPGEGRIRTARSFALWEGGGEYNVVKGLKKCFGLKTGVLTAVADNEIGLLLEDLIQQAGVDTSLIYHMPTDGIGAFCRNGLNFTERGFGLRGSIGCSDRFNTAIAKATPEQFDFEYVFGKLGVRWLHTGGIYAALSEQSEKTLFAALDSAKKYGTAVSYDLNYRASLWTAEKNTTVIEQTRRILEKTDVLIGNEAEFEICLGMKIEENKDPEHDPLNTAGYAKLLKQIAEEFPNLKAIAAILHTVDSASSTSLTSVCWCEGEIYQSIALQDIMVLDSVGAGDAFGTGVIYGMMEANDIQCGIDLGIANSALTMTTPGDTTMAVKKELEALVRTGGASGTR